MRFLTIFLLGLFSAFAGELAWKKQELTAIRGSLLIPEGWFFQEMSEEGVVTYQVMREKPAEDYSGGFVAGFTLTVTPNVPERAEESASAYAADLLPSSPDEPGGKELQKSKENGLIVFRTEYVIEGESENIRVLNLAKANDTTGTLYFLMWQSPENEEADLKEIRKKILSSVVIDSAY